MFCNRSYVVKSNVEKGDEHWNAVAHSDTTADDGGLDSDLDEGLQIFSYPDVWTSILSRFSN